MLDRVLERAQGRHRSASAWRSSSTSARGSPYAAMPLIELVDRRLGRRARRAPRRESASRPSPDRMRSTDSRDVRPQVNRVIVSALERHPRDGRIRLAAPRLRENSLSEADRRVHECQRRRREPVELYGGAALATSLPGLPRAGATSSRQSGSAGRERWRTAATPSRSVFNLRGGTSPR